METVFLAAHHRGINMTGIALFLSNASLKTASSEHIFLFY